MYHYKIISKSCDHCKNATEDVNHFLLDCDRYKEKREHFYKVISAIDRTFLELPAVNKLEFILSLECPVDLQGVCCSFVHDIYSKRQSV